MGALSHEFQKARAVFETVLAIVVLGIPVGVTVDDLVNRAFTSSMSTVESIVLSAWLLVAALAFIYCVFKFMYSSSGSSDDKASKHEK